MAEQTARPVAVVTGASSGIGRALAKELARRGARVGAVARRGDLLDELAREARAAGGTLETAPADVADRDALHAAVHALEAKLGPTDLLIANSGVSHPTGAEAMNVPMVEATMRVNFFGVVYAIEAVLPQMLARKKGHIAAVSSMAGYKGLPGEWGYSSSKAAVNNLMEGLRIQMREHGIAVTNICPGFIKTPMTAKNDFDMPWLLEADDAARRIARALVRKKKVFNFPWQMSWFMGLVAMLPDWIVARSMKKYNENPPWPDRPI
jgi:short-subunit dehydrogenase